MITYLKGNVIAAFMNHSGLQPVMLLHGCNCFNCMGGGIAKIIAKKFPKVEEADDHTISGDINKLGNCSIVEVGINKWIMNCYTQYEMYNDKHKKNGTTPFSYLAWENILREIQKGLHPEVTLYMPKIGAGLAGGDWNKIEALLKSHTANRQVYIYEL